MAGTLNHSPADVLRYLLVSRSAGTLPSDGGEWPIYVASQPDGPMSTVGGGVVVPDSIITLFDTQGRKDGRVMVSGEIQEHYGTQLMIRAPTHSAGWAKANALAITLDQNVNQAIVTIGASSYVIPSVSRTGTIVSLGMESPTSKRRLFSINVVFPVRMTT